MSSNTIETQKVSTQSARDCLQDWIVAEKRDNGLLDVKFCVGNVNSAGSSVEQAAKQFLSIINAKKEGRTRSYSDF